MNDLPDHLRRRIPIAGTVGLVVLLLIATWAAVGVLTDSSDSYAALTGAEKMVTVDDPCTDGICRGTWDDGTGRTREGVVQLPAEAFDKPSRPFTRGASVHGDTAYLSSFGYHRVIGLVAPGVFLGAAIAILVEVSVLMRRERRRRTAIRLWRARYEPA